MDSRNFDTGKGGYKTIFESPISNSFLNSDTSDTKVTCISSKYFETPPYIKKHIKIKKNSTLFSDLSEFRRKRSVKSRENSKSFKILNDKVIRLLILSFMIGFMLGIIYRQICSLNSQRIRKSHKFNNVESYDKADVKKLVINEVELKEKCLDDENEIKIEFSENEGKGAKNKILKDLSTYIENLEIELKNRAENEKILMKEKLELKIKCQDLSLQASKLKEELITQNIQISKIVDSIITTTESHD